MKPPARRMSSLYGHDSGIQAEDYKPSVFRLFYRNTFCQNIQVRYAGLA